MTQKKARPRFELDAQPEIAARQLYAWASVEFLSAEDNQTLREISDRYGFEIIGRLCEAILRARQASTQSKRINLAHAASQPFDDALREAAQALRPEWLAPSGRWRKGAALAIQETALQALERQGMTRAVSARNITVKMIEKAMAGNK